MDLSGLAALGGLPFALVCVAVLAFVFERVVAGSTHRRMLLEKDATLERVLKDKDASHERELHRILEENKFLRDERRGVWDMYRTLITSLDRTTAATTTVIAQTVKKQGELDDHAGRPVAP